MEGVMNASGRWKVNPEIPVKAVQDQLQCDLELQCLGDDIDLQPNLNFTFITDRQKVIIPAIKTVFSSVEHKFFLRHIHENMKHEWCGQAYKDLLWISTSATTVRDFEKCGNNAEANGSASCQAEHVVVQDSSGGSCVSVVIGLSDAGGQDGSGGVGVGVGSQIPVTKTKSANGKEMGDGKPTQSSATGGASEWSIM
uniref:Uncharacterized protein n=1 Tax=Tanacetum cinerariifolium TaxID=118510 RepID=A0A6L2LUF2_TANCI|nr:hypothetical protein [Tanacetum cinerariifolium]